LVAFGVELVYLVPPGPVQALVSRHTFGEMVMASMGAVKGVVPLAIHTWRNAQGLARFLAVRGPPSATISIWAGGGGLGDIQAGITVLRTLSIPQYSINTLDSKGSIRGR
jgi:hypothetical protein